VVGSVSFSNLSDADILLLWTDCSRVGRVTTAVLPELDRRRLDAAVAVLRARLAGYWIVTATNGKSPILSFVGPAAGFDSAVVVADRVDPRDVGRLTIKGRPTVVVAPWLSPRTRELLVDGGVGFVDLTGNIDVRDPGSGFFLSAVGAERDPNPAPRRGPSLKGARAVALMRTLVEVTPPYTAGDLATALDLDDGYVSRALQVLADERLVERVPRGAVVGVDWEALIRRIATTYSLLDSNRTTTWIAAAGPTQLLDDLTRVRGGRWAATGSIVASAIAPVAAPEIAVLYADDPERLAKAARLLPATIGANVIVAEPYDDIVFTRLRQTDNVSTVSVAQAVIDLLTGPGRMPAEGDALLAWMIRNEAKWRAGNLEQ
jgi:hypothetical protein